LGLEKLLIIIIWGMAFLAFFKIKFLVKRKSISRHDEIFGKHWTQHSIHTTSNYLKLVFFPKNWIEFDDKKFIVWVMIAYIANVIGFSIVFYPLLSVLVKLIFGE